MMGDFTKQMSLLKTTIDNLSKERNQVRVNFITAEVKTILTKKWLDLMINALTKMRANKNYDDDLLEDLKTIVKRIPQQRFVEAILSIQPFRPNFASIPVKSSQSLSFLRKSVNNCEQVTHLLRPNKSQLEGQVQSSSILRFKQSICSKIDEISDQSCYSLPLTAKMSVMEELIQLVTEEQTLSKQFESNHHPFRKILDSFVFILQNKFKNIIEASEKNQSELQIQRIQELIIYDLKVIEEFLIRAAEPYLSIFKTYNQKQRRTFKLKMQQFVKQYVQKHEKINHSVRKIMRMAARKSPLIINLTKNLPNFVQVNNFKIDEIFKIDGCYVQSMNALMEFAETFTSKESLQKLIDFRRSIALDVDDYYRTSQRGTAKGRQISTEIQREIIKFVLMKLKGWLPEIYAQLKYLQIVYGDEDMAYKYDDASYMYAQIDTAIEILAFEGKNMC